MASLQEMLRKRGRVATTVDGEKFMPNGRPSYGMGARRLMPSRVGVGTQSSGMTTGGGIGSALMMGTGPQPSRRPFRDYSPAGLPEIQTAKPRFADKPVDLSWVKPIEPIGDDLDIEPTGGPLLPFPVAPRMPPPAAVGQGRIPGPTNYPPGLPEPGAPRIPGEPLGRIPGPGQGRIPGPTGVPPRIPGPGQLRLPAPAVGAGAAAMNDATRRQTVRRGPNGEFSIDVEPVVADQPGVDTGPAPMSEGWKARSDAFAQARQRSLEANRDRPLSEGQQAKRSAFADAMEARRAAVASRGKERGQARDERIQFASDAQTMGRNPALIRAFERQGIAPERAAAMMQGNMQFLSEDNRQKALAAEAASRTNLERDDLTERRLARQAESQQAREEGMSGMAMQMAQEDYQTRLAANPSMTPQQQQDAWNEAMATARIRVGGAFGQQGQSSQAPVNEADQETVIRGNMRRNESALNEAIQRAAATESAASGSGLLQAWRALRGGRKPPPIRQTYPGLRG